MITTNISTAFVLQMWHCWLSSTEQNVFNMRRNRHWGTTSHCVVASVKYKPICLFNFLDTGLYTCRTSTTHIFEYLTASIHLYDTVSRSVASGHRNLVGMQVSTSTARSTDRNERNELSRQKAVQSLAVVWTHVKTCAFTQCVLDSNRCCYCGGVGE